MLPHNHREEPEPDSDDDEEDDDEDLCERHEFVQSGYCLNCGIHRGEVKKS